MKFKDEREVFEFYKNYLTKSIFLWGKEIRRRVMTESYIMELLRAVGKAVEPVEQMQFWSLNQPFKLGAMAY